MNKLSAMRDSRTPHLVILSPQTSVAFSDNRQLTEKRQVNRDRLVLRVISSALSIKLDENLVIISVFSVYVRSQQAVYYFAFVQL